MNVEIIVAPFGWVFVGRVKETAKGLLIKDGFSIRVWGTSKGLGEIAAEGPKKQTILDFLPEITIPSAVVRIACNAESWSKVCP